MGLELLLGCLVVSGMLMTVPRAIADVIATVKAASAGEWGVVDRDRDRRAERAGRWAGAWRRTREDRHRQAGGDGEYQPGLGAYLGDVYHGWCQDLIDRRHSKREQRGPAVYDPDRTPWHVRVDEAVFALGRRARQALQDRGETAGAPAVVDDSPRPNPADSTGSVDVTPPAPAPADDDREGAVMGERTFDWRCNQCPASVGGFLTEQSAHADAEHHMRWAHPAPATTPPPVPQDTEPEGDDMTQPTTGGNATGDAHDLESASHQCDLLDDDLTAINTALDVIDERIGSAGTATELIEAFLKRKNMPDTAVGGMSVARDMLSPTHIKALIDALAAAKQGVRASKEAIDTMNDQATEALQGADGSVVNNR